MSTTLTHDTTFHKVEVDYAVRGVTRVSWRMHRHFTDPAPWSFQLQVSRDGDEFADVGIPVTNTFYAMDDTARLYGKDSRLVYRVVLTTPNGKYTSQPAQIMGKLATRQWLIAREIIRRHRLQAKQTGLRVLDGYLLRRKIVGPACDCLDPHTGGITNHDHEACFGTGIVGGYWQAEANGLIDLSPETHATKRTLQRGTVTDNAARGRFCGTLWVNRNDVWVDAASDRRFYIANVQNAAEVNQVPIIVDVEMRLAEASDIVYKIPL